MEVIKWVLHDGKAKEVKINWDDGRSIGWTDDDGTCMTTYYSAVFESKEETEKEIVRRKAKLMEGC